MAAVLFRFEDGESDKIKRSGRMPTVEGSIDTDQEDTIKVIGAILGFTMQAGNMAFHELTSCGLE
jgi:hypothetical protein